MEINVPSHIQNPAAYRRAVERKIAQRQYEARQKKAGVKRAEWLREDESRGALIVRLISETRKPRCSDFFYSLLSAYENWGCLTEKQEAALRSSFAKADARALDLVEENREAAARSCHAGRIGDRQKFTLKLVRCWRVEGDYGDYDGHILEDASGNQFCYMGNRLAMEVDETREITATVKDHSEWHGVKQTRINRPKVEEVRQSEQEFLASRFSTGASKPVKIG